jgi:hypothetical protein
LISDLAKIHPAGLEISIKNKLNYAQYIAIANSGLSLWLVTTLQDNPLKAQPFNTLMPDCGVAAYHHPCH